MSNKKWILIGLVISLIIGLLGWPGILRALRTRDRKRDIHLLTQTFIHSQNKITNVDELISQLELRGIRLKNPIRLDSTRPSYRLMPQSDRTPFAVIEETNVTEKYIFRSTSDGAIFMPSPIN